MYLYHCWVLIIYSLIIYLLLKEINITNKQKNISTTIYIIVVVIIRLACTAYIRNANQIILRGVCATCWSFGIFKPRELPHQYCVQFVHTSTYKQVECLNLRPIDIGTHGYHTRIILTWTVRAQKHVRRERTATSNNTGTYGRACASPAHTLRHPYVNSRRLLLFTRYIFIGSDDRHYDEVRARVGNIYLTAYARDPASGI